MNIQQDLTSFLKSAKKPLIAIVGPTASGKTQLSLSVAKFSNGEIISTDSRQIYQEMPISTDIILPKEQQGIPHHMLAIAKPDETITLADYTEKALQIINNLHAKNKVPILAGGTGLYLSAIIDSYKLKHIPPNPALRAKLEQEAAEKGSEHLYKRLQTKDPQAAGKIHPNNLRYIIRALEINASGTQKKDEKTEKPPFDTFLIGPQRPREEIYKRINARVDQQVGRGLVEEVQALLNKGYSENLPSMSSLGVKEIIPYIKGKMSIEECLEVLKQGTRKYAKRQMTWFRRYDNVHWISPQNIKEFTASIG